MRLKRKRILAISSGGGHWVQLLRVLGAFCDYDVAYVSVAEAYRSDVAGARYYVIRDATRWDRVWMAVMAVQILLILVRERPDTVISTGAAPGYFAMRFAKWFHCKTIWLDSIANAKQLSLSGQRAGPYADLWLTQWPHLAKCCGPFYRGAVL